ncbi:carbamoyltransferase HypF [Stygiolobus caldivivus]|uniref:Carbamoyltransferase n=1 Tax=Stygiolobus caldivivus TaxID=2824673 RepID=A0A8D5U4J2_9CREN|nr:carbamoyltransferase HypF [Stygiolobus caldivivus]BCU68829.1 carbamoyltransferase HypF [Stygiolobus caldivivus]
MACYKLTITGIVQGVGFRPFIFRIARKSGLRGYVKNLGGSEVEVLIQGDKQNIGYFMERLFRDVPEVAKIEKVVSEEVECGEWNDFSILPSGDTIKEPSQIPPDFAVCEDCLKEVLDQKDRRFRYPFNSCVKCGPRYSMLYTAPYDRENTSMKDFPLCEDCLHEYRDPDNERRFDAQGISCPQCGPKLYLTTIDGDVVGGDPFVTTAKLLSEGYIIAVKGIGGFHIIADPFNDDVVLKLRNRKNRPQKPFAVMAKSLEVIEKYAVITDKERELLTSPERPIVLLRKRGDDYTLSKYISPGLDREGFFLFYTPLHYLLLEEYPQHLFIATSGNRHGSPMCINEECVREKLKGIVDYVLFHNRKIVNRVDDSVIRVSADRTILLRRSRGFAPLWIELKDRVLKEDVIALGAELQNAGAVALKNKVILTQYIGDTDEYSTLMELEDYILKFVKMYSLRPRVVIVDKNPVYQSVYLGEKLAEKFSAKLVKVQHHVAHVLSVAAENGIERGVGIGIDGIGYGDDGNGWGGEIIKFEGASYERKHHLKYVPYTGGDVNAMRPRRMLAMFLSTLMKWDEAVKFAGIREEEARILEKVIRKPGLMTSSTGRFLDAVSALLNVCDQRTYEGEPAMKLEAVARGGRLLDLSIKIKGEEIDTPSAFQWLIENMDKYDVKDIAYTVQYRLGEALIKAAIKYDNRVVVSGGAAVNEYILRGMLENSEGAEVILPRKVPANDGGIALGQVYYYALNG